MGGGDGRAARATVPVSTWSPDLAKTDATHDRTILAETIAGIEEILAAISTGSASNARLSACFSPA
jgi:hypothetical protein